ncbi:MAG TPA: hypothetical protein VF868_05590 [Bacteroidia bacterium]|jgi:hypothetical protein
MILRSGLFACFCIIIHSCTKEKGAVPFQVSDRSLFRLVQETAGSGYYQSGAVLPGAGNSPHGSFKLRMNSVAQRVLNVSGELPAGAVFPDSSFLVKEIQSAGPIQYAVMYKNGKSWDWAEFNSSGEPYYSVAKKGGACISCHSGASNRDLVRTFDLH